MSRREHAHELIDRLPETQLSALLGLLEAIVDPAAAALCNAPIDDEPETGKEKVAVTKARDWLKHNGGKGIAHDDAMRRLGLECGASLVRGEGIPHEKILREFSLNK